MTYEIDFQSTFFWLLRYFINQVLEIIKMLFKMVIIEMDELFKKFFFVTNHILQLSHGGFHIIINHCFIRNEVTHNGHYR